MWLFISHDNNDNNTIMATVYFFISSGAAPFTASIDPAVVPDLTGLATGQHYFTNVPDGSYTVLVTDALGCESSFPVAIACSTTTTTVCEDCTTTTTTECEGCTTTTTTAEVTTTTTTCYLEYFIWETPCSLVTTTTTTVGITTTTTTAEITTTTTTVAIEDINYGLLYNWYAATDARNIAPEGWRVPIETDFVTFENYLGGRSVAGGKLKETGTTYWDSPNAGATNEYLFNGRGSGYRLYDGSFNYFKIQGVYHSATSYSLDYSYYRDLSSNNTIFGFTIDPSIAYKKAGYNIRWIKDDSTDPGTVTGNDGKVYSTVKIGNQVWTSCNIAETKYRTGDSIPEITDGATWAGLTTGALCAYNNDWNNV